MTHSPPSQGLYDPAYEHDACGVGFVADVEGRRTHGIVRKGLAALCRMDHRGARGAEPNTGDGAGVMIQVPDELYRAVSEAMDSGRPTLVNAVIDPAAGSESGNIGSLNPQSALTKK